MIKYVNQAIYMKAFIDHKKKLEDEKNNLDENIEKSTKKLNNLASENNKYVEKYLVIQKYAIMKFYITKKKKNWRN